MNFGEHILIAKEAREAGQALRNANRLPTHLVPPGTMKANATTSTWLAEMIRRLR